MNGATLFVLTFLVWIGAKGRLPKYIALVETRDVDGTKDDTPTSDLPALPKLPQLKSVQDSM